MAPKTIDDKEALGLAVELIRLEMAKYRRIRHPEAAERLAQLILAKDALTQLKARVGEIQRLYVLLGRAPNWGDLEQ